MRFVPLLCALVLAACGGDAATESEAEHGPEQGVGVHTTTTGTDTTPENLHSPDTDLGHPEDDGG